MFWKYNNTSSPQFEAVLQKEDVTLQELMEEDDIIQECKSQNKKLVDFLCKRDVLEELVTLITEEPSEELDERTRFKYPNIACELLTCDVPALNESLSRDNELLEKLYSFIDRDPPLNPLLASFLSRTLGVLIVKRLDQHWISYQFTCLQAMGFLKDKENFIGLLLKHLGTSAIMDLTLKLITEVGDAEHRQNLLNWLDSQNLVQSLVALFDPKVDSERHHNAAQLICDVLRISRDALNEHRDRLDTDPILARLEAPETVALMMDHMLNGEKSESSIVGGIQVLLALLLQKNSFNDNNVAYNNEYDEIEYERKEKIANSIGMVILNRLKDFHQLLIEPPKKPAVKTSINILDPPLGNTRLQITKLINGIISLNNADLLRELMRLGTVELLLDLFFKYEWNNFLHAQVQQCLYLAMQTQVTPVETDDMPKSDNLMYPYLIVKCRLLNRILEAWEDNEQKQKKPKGIRQGYMGHLINIANEVVQQCQRNSALDQFITENVEPEFLEKWNNFVNSTLAETNKTQQVVLGGVHPNNLVGDDSNEDYNIPYPQAAVLHQQMQQMTPDIIENYGFHNDDFSDPDDLHNPLERRGNMNLVTEGDLTRQAEAFKKVCSEYINTLDDADDVIFEEQSTEQKNENWDPRDSSSDDEDNPPPENRMDVDPWSNLEANRSTITLLEPKDPWSTPVATAEATQADGWADFGNFAVKFDSEPLKTTSETSLPTTTISETSLATTVSEMSINTTPVTSTSAIAVTATTAASCTLPVSETSFESISESEKNISPSVVEFKRVETEGVEINREKSECIVEIKDNHPAEPVETNEKKIKGPEVDSGLTEVPVIEPISEPMASGDAGGDLPASHESQASDSVTSDPVTSDPAPSDSVTSDPAPSDSVTSDSVPSESD